MKPKIGAYLRVSTSDGKQTTRSQREAIRQWAKLNHVPTTEIRWYEEKRSGKNLDRPQLAKLLRAIDRNRIDTLVVFRLDRLARSTRDGLQVLSDVADKGTRVVSVSENIDFGNSTGRLIASILLSVASFEREVTVERIKAGMSAAKAAGKQVGRPRNEKRLARIAKMRQSGMSVIDIAERLNVTRQSIYTALSRMQECA